MKKIEKTPRSRLIFLSASSLSRQNDITEAEALDCIEGIISNSYAGLMKKYYYSMSDRAQGMLIAAVIKEAKTLKSCRG